MSSILGLAFVALFRIVVDSSAPAVLGAASVVPVLAAAVTSGTGDATAEMATLGEIGAYLGGSGPAGPPGPEGPQGPSGAQGVQGPAGQDGEVGPEGPAGADGNDGAAGATGASGAQGAQGIQGPAGETGPQGTTGTAGSAGATGSQGPPGNDGAAGATGSQGIQGIQGPAGNDGAPATQAWADITGKPSTFAPIIGGGAGDAVAGNDSRLTDARTPTAHSHPATAVSDSTAAGRAVLTAADAAAQRTALGLGTAATTAAAAYATAAQGTDSRAPTGNAGGDLSGTYPNPTIGAGRVTSAMHIETSAATSATTGVMTVNMVTELITITPTGACTFNAAAGGRLGRIVTFLITTSGVSSFVLTWGTNFRKTGTLATGTVSARFFAVTFRCIDGTIWQEIARTAVQT